MENQPILLEQSNLPLVSLKQIKQYLKIEEKLDEILDELLLNLYKASINYIELYLNCDIELKTYCLSFTNYYSHTIKIPNPNIHKLLEIKAKNYNELVALSSNEYQLYKQDHLSLLRPQFYAELQIFYQCGFNETTLPPALKQAILEYILVSFNQETEVPKKLKQLLRLFKKIRI
ncbi:hypothetical protein [Rickettsiales endosymbiont of Stachyamoeba lipophora]|uniref:hypothetical protein n=1 Tax=Rickettsiales endosymbiont of Stachyamoeba lipophora TaxID=2486578 RepID=UPI000F64780E|nr:hypothetical protein [Rickettsiales endosymbiont of Stachyamoeba lipophora]AZL15549.1 hypothetical protein EF513_03150 [Rickettsiales endosymbiont of Stachyamoeba lipophora]